MIILFDAASIQRDALTLTGDDKLTEVLLLRLAYKAKMLWHPDGVVVLRHPGLNLPFNGTERTLDPIDLLANSNIDLSQTVLVSNDPRLLGLADLVHTTYTTTKDLTNLHQVTYNRVKDKMLGFNPKDTSVFFPSPISVLAPPIAPDKKDKGAAGRTRKERWAWVTNDRSDLRSLAPTSDNIHVKIGKTGFQNYEIVQDIPSLLRVLDQAKGVVGWDTETTGLNWRADQVVGESISIDGSKGYYVPLRHQLGGGQAHNISPDEYSQRVRPRLSTLRLRGANLGFDILFTCRDGLGFPRDLEDIQGYAYMLGINVPDQSQIGLKALSRSVLGDAMEEYAEVSGGKTFDQVPIERAAPYAADDAVKSYRIAEALRKRLSPEQRDRYDQIEMPFLRTLIRMQYNGMYLDPDKLAGVLSQFRSELDNVEATILSMAGETFNIASPNQLQRILFDKLALPTTRRTKTGWSTAIDVLEEIEGSHPIVSELIDQREFSKLINTYLATYTNFISDDERIHSHLQQFKVISGRIASSEPNLMNIPARTDRGQKIRTLFMGQGDDLLLGCDAGQLEYRILAHYLDDPLLIATFNDPTRDVHSETASLIFDVPPSQVTKAQRDVSKTAFYAILYGAAAPKLAATLNVSIGEAARVMSKIKSALNIDKLQTRVLEDVRRLGYVESLGGHRSYIHNIKSFNSKDRGHAERAAFDSLFQGTASGDVTKIACVRVQDALDKLYPNLLQPEVRLVLQVHDEILLEGPRHELEGLTGLVETSFINALPQLRVPLTAESKIGKSWSEVH